MLIRQCQSSSYLEATFLRRRRFKNLLIKLLMAESSDEDIPINGIGNMHIRENDDQNQDDREFQNQLATLLGLNPDELPPQDVERRRVLIKAAVKRIYLLGTKDVASPKDIHDIQTYTRQEVQELFEQQHQYRWTHENQVIDNPREFSFYRFCQQEGCQNFRTYNIRRAHVSERLWRAQDQLRQIRDLKGLQLCPPVYARSRRGRAWAKWIRNGKKWENVTRDGIDINWITNDEPNPELTNFIRVNSVRKNYTKFPTGKNNLYWVVFKEDDPADRQQNENLPLKAQVYVGRTQCGITKRWREHCKKMEEARNLILSESRLMQPYDGIALRSFQLVHLRLLLHKALQLEGDNSSGLFIMKWFDNNLVNAETNHIKGRIPAVNIDGWAPNNMNYGMNYDYQT